MTALHKPEITVDYTGEFALLVRGDWSYRDCPTAELPRMRDFYAKLAARGKGKMGGPGPYAHIFEPWLAAIDAAIKLAAERRAKRAAKAAEKGDVS
jgi:hypothetical protein